MKNAFLGIDGDRLLHAQAVGERIAEIGREFFAWDERKCQEMFILGYLHDVGYRYSRNQLEHEEVGGLLLKEAGYKYWQEVYYHGVPDADYQSDELLALNMADMETSKSGQRISMDERLKDIANRYGDDSVQYRKAAALVEEITEQVNTIEARTGKR
ncbi:MAG: phosphohydrolase [Actinomycetaceae bacterium]|nr:phosphohydrolase [Actinomycetaceae bacterium]